MKLNDQDFKQEKIEIKLNRKMRTWNKYKKYVYAGGGILVVVLLMFLILKGCGKDSDSKDSQTTIQEQTTTVDINIQETTTQEQTTAQVQTTTQAQVETSIQISGTATEQEFVGKDKFAGVTFIGDSVISGFSYYQYIDDANVISDGSMTSDKAADYISSIADTNPSKVVIMVGLNDLNYGTRGADTIAEYIADFTSKVKSSIPSANIYVLSVLPVTSGFEASGNVSITQSGIDELNSTLSAQAAAKSYTYIDVASAFKDGTGYMNSSYTGNGTNIYNEYYPFLLNGIAGVLK